MPTKQNFNDQETFASLRCTAKLVVQDGREIPVRIVRRGLHATEITVQRDGLPVRSLKLRGDSCRIVPEDPVLRAKMPEGGSMLLKRASFTRLKDITLLDGNSSDGLEDLMELSVFAQLLGSEDQSNGDSRPSPKAPGKRRKGQQTSEEPAGGDDPLGDML